MDDRIGARARVEEIPREECLRLLASQPIGRVAVTIAGDAPHVVPVNFIVEGEAVVFRSDLGAKIKSLRVGPISFEVDAVDPGRRTGWSVLVQGPAYEATHWETDHLTLQPWAGGDKSHWVRLIPSMISGRRILLEELPHASAGYL
jgi:uncharacterized protein